MRLWPPENLPPFLRPTLTREVGLVIVLQGAVFLGFTLLVTVLAHRGSNGDGARLSAFAPYAWAAVAATLVLAAWGLWATSRRIAAPVRRLALAARAIAYGDYSRRLHEEGLFDELGDLARSFDAMAARIEEAETAEFLAERHKAEWQDMLIHDVKSPLSVVLGSAKLLLETPGRPPDEARLLDGSRRSAERIMYLLNTYLDVMRMEAGAHELVKSRVPLSEAAAEALALLEPLAREAGMALSAEVPPEAVVDADRGLLVRVIVNLAGNAVKYAAAGRRAVVAARPAGAGWRLGVRDEGPGIAPGDLPFVFERFYRAKREGGRSGTGLGLAFCRLAADLHGWRIRAESQPGRGTEMIIEIPGKGNHAPS